MHFTLIHGKYLTVQKTKTENKKPELQNGYELVVHKTVTAREVRILKVIFYFVSLSIFKVYRVTCKYSQKDCM